MTPFRRRQLEPLAHEAAIVARIAALRRQGRSLRAIAAALTADGLATKRGGRWYAATVRKVMRRLAGETP